MGAIQSAIDRKKQERSTERMQEAGIDPAQYVRENKNIPDFPSGGESTIFFQRVPEDYIIRHANDKFRVAGRDRLSYIERLDLPAYSPDSVRTLQGPEAWQKAKQLLKAVIKGDTDELGRMADQATKRGGYIQKRQMGGSVWDDDEYRNATALGGRNPNPWFSKFHTKRGFI